jgi:RND family efflux transporter MFP subunit
MAVLPGSKKKLNNKDNAIIRRIKLMRFLFNINCFKPIAAQRPTVFKRLYSTRIINKNRRLNLFILWISLLFLFIVPVAGYASLPDSESAPVPLVAVEPVIVQDINPPEDYVGHVEAIQAVDLRARVEGFLEKINFKEGDVVKSGDLLYVIEQAPYQTEVDVSKAGVAEAEAELVRANQHIERLQTALPESIPAMDIDEAIATQLRAKAQIAQAKAVLARSELNITYTMIHAPISGRIGRTTYTKGNLVGPTSVPLARIVQMDPVRVVFSISENDLTIIQSAMENNGINLPENPVVVTRLRLSDGTLFDANGRIDFVDNEVDRTTGTISVRAEFANPSGRLIPGQYINVLLTMAEPNLLPVVSQAAVQQDHDGSYVLTVDKDNRVVMRRVKTGPVVDDIWAIETGLNEGDLVIVQGIQKVQPGMTVKTTINDNGQGR